MISVISLTVVVMLGAAIAGTRHATEEAAATQHVLVNIASIGQVVPHLHWHIIPRYKDDPRWGGPIWTTNPDEMRIVHLKDAEYEALAERIRSGLDRQRR